MPIGDYNIEVSNVGYKTFIKKISLNNKTPNLRLNIQLPIDENELDEIVVSGRKVDANVSEAIMSSQKLKMIEIKKIPALMGEVDVIKAIQLLPGVQAASEGSSGFSVRGGGIDQNLILLDDATIYNASHMMGFFSVFYYDFVSEATLLKVDIPSVYFCRLSSFLDVSLIYFFPANFSVS